MGVTVAVHVHRALIGTNVLINQIHFPVSWPEAYHSHLDLSLNVHLLSHLSISNPTLPPETQSRPRNSLRFEYKTHTLVQNEREFPPNKGDGGIDRGRALD